MCHGADSKCCPETHAFRSWFPSMLSSPKMWLNDNRSNLSKGLIKWLIKKNMNTLLEDSELWEVGCNGRNQVARGPWLWEYILSPGPNVPLLCFSAVQIEATLSLHPLYLIFYCISVPKQMEPAAHRVKTLTPRTKVSLSSHWLVPLECLHSNNKLTHRERENILGFWNRGLSDFLLWHLLHFLQ